MTRKLNDRIIILRFGKTKVAKETNKSQGC